MTSKYFDWLSAQIEEHVKLQLVPQGYDFTALTRLVDAAGALQGGGAGAQAFGLQLPAGGVENAAVLVDRCLAVVRARMPLLDQRTRDELGAHLRRRGFDSVVAAPTSPYVTHSLRVRLAVSVEDGVSEEPLTDAATLQRLDGLRERSKAALVDLPCIRSAITAARGDEARWIHGGFAKLAFDEHAGVLRCELVFDVSREPSQQQLLALLRAIKGPLFESSWLLNIDWAFGEDAPDVIVHLESAIVSYELAAA